MSEFVQRRLSQLPPMGARLGVTVMPSKRHLVQNHAHVYVSTISMADTVWTRVETPDKAIMRHYPGDLLNGDAVDRLLADMETQQ